MTFYISLADISGVSTNSIGVLFNSNEENFEKGDIFDKKTAAELNKSIKCIQAADYTEKDVFSFLIDLSREETFKNAKNWMLIETEFIANGSEKYFTIGNFKNNKQTKYELTRRKIKDIQSYYYIDDVSIFNITNQINQKTSFETNKTYTLKSVQFEFDSTTLIDTSKEELNQLAEVLLKNPILKITINGHTDYLGKAAYNQKLSEDRAKSVADYLISKGISKNKITSKGYGKSQPIDPNEPEDAQAKNKRVEFILTI